MDYLWKLGALTSSFTFPYTIGDFITHTDRQFDGWTLQSGFDKKTKDNVLIHRFCVSNNTNENIEIAQKNIANCKKLHHPYILKYKYSEEDSTYITLVTEYAVPLELYLDSIKDDESWYKYITYGLLCVMEGLSFIHQHAGFQHNKLSLNSIYVTNELEWKISGFGYTSNIGNQKCIELYNQYTLKDCYSACIPFEHKLCKNVDLWSLACISYVLYNWKEKHEWGNKLNILLLKSLKNIPAEFANSFKKLLSFSDFNLDDIIIHEKQPHGLFHHKWIHFRQKLLYIYSFNDNELIDFFSVYKHEIDHIPPEIGIFKLFPIILNFYNFGKLLHIIQPIIIYIVSNFIKNIPPDNEKYKLVDHTNLKEIICNLWTSTDRHTRLCLLKTAENLLKYLNDKNIVGKKIFTNYNKGFIDSCLELKVESAKCIPIFLEQLQPKDINTKFIPFICGIFEKSQNKEFSIQLIESFKKGLKYLPSDSILILISSISSRLTVLAKRPTHFIHDILNFFSCIHTHLSCNVLATVVIPSLSQLLICSNKSVRKDAVNLCNTIIDFIVQSSDKSPLNDNIYYDTDTSLEYPHHINQSTNNSDINISISKPTIENNLHKKSFKDDDYDILNKNSSNEKAFLSTKISKTVCKNNSVKNEISQQYTIRNHNQTTAVSGWDIDDWTDNCLIKNNNISLNITDNKKNNANVQDDSWEDW